MSGKLVVVTGITGNQGGSVANAFLDAGWKVRGISRDPSKPSGKKWTDKGVELVAGDFDSPDKLRSAFTGAAAIFANTDYWSNMANPANHAKAASTGRPVTEICHESEAQQGKNVIDAAAAAAMGTLEYFILSTLSATKKLSGGKYTHAHHFDAKADQVEYLFGTEGLKGLKEKTQLIQMPFFVNNWKVPGSEFLMPAKQPDGTFLLRVPISPKRAIPMGDPTKICGPFAVALTKVPPGKNLVCAAGMLTLPQWCEKVSKRNNIEIKFEQASRKYVEELIPGGVGEELVDMFEYYTDFGYDGGDPTVIYPDKLGVDVKYQTTDEYFETEDFSKLVNQ